MSTSLATFWHMHFFYLCFELFDVLTFDSSLDSSFLQILFDFLFIILTKDIGKWVLLQISTGNCIYSVDSLKVTLHRHFFLIQSTFSLISIILVFVLILILPLSIILFLFELFCYDNFLESGEIVDKILTHSFVLSKL